MDLFYAFIPVQIFRCVDPHLRLLLEKIGCIVLYCQYIVVFIFGFALFSATTFVPKKGRDWVSRVGYEF